MASAIVIFIVGAVCVALGIAHTKGHISSLHAYHRNRVREEDRIPFGRTVGLGTIIMGGALCVNGILGGVGYLTGEKLFTWIGIGVMSVGLLVGLGISFYAMVKYNKGIF